MFQSDRASQFMFQVKEGKTNPIQSIYKTKGLIRDITLKPPAHTKKPFTNPPAPNAYRCDFESLFLRFLKEDLFYFSLNNLFKIFISYIFLSYCVIF